MPKESQGKVKGERGGKEAKSDDFFKECRPQKLSGDTLKLLRPQAIKEVAVKTRVKAEKKQLWQRMKQAKDKFDSDARTAEFEHRKAMDRLKASQGALRKVRSHLTAVTRRAQDLSAKIRDAQGANKYKRHFQGNTATLSLRQPVSCSCLELTPLSLWQPKSSMADQV